MLSPRPPALVAAHGWLDAQGYLPGSRYREWEAPKLARLLDQYAAEQARLVLTAAMKRLEGQCRCHRAYVSRNRIDPACQCHDLADMIGRLLRESPICAR